MPYEPHQWRRFSKIAKVRDAEKCTAIRNPAPHCADKQLHTTSEVQMSSILRRANMIAATLLPFGLVTAPHGAADPTSALTQAVSAARSASDCPGLQWDPLVQRAAQMANQATSDYHGLRTGAVPFTDPMPALKAIGYRAGGNGMVLTGYGPTESEALQGLVLQYRASKPACSYTTAGVDTMRDAAGFNLAAAVLIAPSQ